MRYLVCTEPQTEGISVIHHADEEKVDMGYGTHWAMVEAHSPEEALKCVQPDEAREGEVALVVELEGANLFRARVGWEQVK